MGGWKINYFFSWLTSRLVNRGRSPRHRTYRHILVVRLDEIGDMVTSLPVFDRLREVFPEATLTAWVSPLTESLLSHQEAIDNITTMPPSGKKFDLIVDLRGNFTTMRFALGQRSAIRLDRGSVRFRNKFLRNQHPHEVMTNLQVIEPVTGPSPASPVVHLQVGRENESVAEEFTQSQVNGRFVLFHAGARKALRRWPGDRFAALGDQLHKRFGLDIVFTCTPDELEEVKAITGSMRTPAYIFTGHTLPDLAALAARASLFVGNESGPMHLAAAMQVPVIGLFGPGEPHVFAPFGARCAFIHHKLECNPCDQVHCKYPGNTCMQRIAVEEVMREAEKLLG